MGADDNLHASIAHVVLAITTGNGIREFHTVGENFRYPGMHSNLFIHGIVGFLHYQSKFVLMYPLPTVLTKCNIICYKKIVGNRYFTLVSGGITWVGTRYPRRFSVLPAFHILGKSKQEYLPTCDKKK